MWDKINNIADEALVPGVGRLSAAMVVAMTKNSEWMSDYIN